MNFDIKTEQISDDSYVISLAGEVDLYTAPEFKQQLLEVIGQGGKQVIVDFTSTTFIDSTTLGVLVGGVKRLRANDGQLSLVCSDRNITKIFEITGLDRVFAIYETRADAVSNLDGVSQPSWRALRKALVQAAALLLIAFGAAGCGAVGRVTSGDTSEGKASFQKNCGSCHTLADAKTSGAIGPNLDDAFSSDKTQGFSEQTMADIVRGQIAYPEEPMPANIVRGSEADSVALYIAKCAGNANCGVTAARAAPPAGTTTTAGSGGGGGGPDGKQVFASAGCGGCHTLKDAGSSGNVGPNLDQLKPTQSAVAHQVEVGGGAMPAFKGRLSAAEIQAVAKYVSSVAGK
jgi:anti-sigma B factor antagonist